MKRKLNPKAYAMMAGCAIVVNAGHIGGARAQGMPDAAWQTVQTMRPMQTHTNLPASIAHATWFDDRAYGGVSAGTQASSPDTRDETCAAAMSSAATKGCSAQPRPQ